MVARERRRRPRRLAFSIIVMVVVVMVVPTGIGAPLRIERRLDGRRGAAKTLDHLRDHMIGADADAIPEKLCRQVAIAEMPGDANERGSIGGSDLKKRLRRSANADAPPILRNERIAVAQVSRTGQVQQQRFSRHGGEPDAPAMPTVMVEHHLVIGRPAPAACGEHFCRAQHRQ